MFLTLTQVDGGLPVDINFDHVLAFTRADPKEERPSKVVLAGNQPGVVAGGGGGSVLVKETPAEIRALLARGRLVPV
jgi:hypothetical protein